jgi:guanylate kinase
VSATTRRPRPGETQGADYWFLSDDEFEERARNGDFVEHAEYSGRRYGTLWSELRTRGAAGRPVLLEIEVQGARQIRQAMPDTVQVFIAPPSKEALRARLVGRGTDDPEQIARRLETAERELEAQDEFSHVVVNDRLEDAVAELERIVRASMGPGISHLDSGK